MQKIKLVCGNHSQERVYAHADNPYDPKRYLCEKGCENELSEKQFDAMIVHLLQETDEAFANLTHHKWKRGKVTFAVLEHTDNEIVVQYVNKNKIGK